MFNYVSSEVLFNLIIGVFKLPMAGVTAFFHHGDGLMAALGKERLRLTTSNCYVL